MGGDKVGFQDFCKGSTSWNLNRPLKSWMILDDLGIFVILSASWEINILESLKYWLIMVHLGTLVHLGKSVFGTFEILNNYSTSWESFFGIFEILNNYGTSWKINILESSSTYRLPLLHPAARVFKGPHWVIETWWCLSGRFVFFSFAFNPGPMPSGWWKCECLAKSSRGSRRAHQRIHWEQVIRDSGSVCPGVQNAPALGRQQF